MYNIYYCLLPREQVSYSVVWWGIVPSSHYTSPDNTERTVPLGEDINRIVIQYGKRTTGSIHSGWTKVLGYINTYSFVIDIVIGNGYVSFAKD